MGIYIPHQEGTIQTIVRCSLTQYQAYAGPSQNIIDRLEQFAGCADWSKGVARIRCEDCGHSYFRPFSCKVFHLCPSCDQKRTLLYAEYLAEDLLPDLPHRQFVFTIPKILRPYFKSDKRLFGEVSRLIFSLLSEFFSLAAGQALLCACVVSYQPLWRVCPISPAPACFGAGRRIYTIRLFCVLATWSRLWHAQGLASGAIVAVPAKRIDRPGPCEHAPGLEALRCQHRKRNYALQQS